MRAGARTDATAWRHAPASASPAGTPADLRAVMAALAAGPRLAPGVSIDWQLPAHALWVAMAPAVLAQTLSRLLALAAGLLAPAGGVLRVHARADGTTAAISMVDEPADRQPPMLARHVHGCSQAVQPARDAALLPLAECAQAIDAHRGRLYAAPSAWGAMGATLRLPLAACAKEQV
ncbi:MAG: hypothetical protein J7603_13515 [Pseudacidovorax sp.]|nr:hypothetical protein [Pseudacidovorax sp.]